MSGSPERTAEGEPGEGRPRPRARLFAAWAVGSVLVLALALVLGAFVRSPLDVAIDNAAAQPLVSARAETRTGRLADDPLTGTVVLGAEWTVPAPATDVARQVVTAVGVEVGDRLDPGEVLVTVSGRPLLGWDLPYPPYRDLVPGDSGDDVRVVQDVLASQGLLAGQPDGRYGPATARAVRTLYERAGVEPPAPSADLVAAVEAARDALELVQDAAAPAAPTSDEGVEAGGAAADLARAQADLETAQAAADTPLPMGEVVTVPAAGALVTSAASVGDVLGGDSATLAALRTSEPTVTVRVPVDLTEQFATGTFVSVTSRSAGAEPVEATVLAVGPFDTGDDGLLPGRDVTVGLPADHGFADAADVLVTPVTDRNEIEGLAVPLVALRREGDQTYVLRLVDEPDGQTNERVVVQVSATVDGYAFVAAGDLEEGDEVVVAGG